jgi:hypothetical protein
MKTAPQTEPAASRRAPFFGKPGTGGAFVQPRLRVGPAHDAFEAEADRVAEAAVRGGEFVQPQLRVNPSFQRKCTRCEEEEKLLQRKDTGEVSAATSAVEATLARPGQALDPSTRQWAESRLGHDFSEVKIHQNAAAAHSAASIGARAYTSGQDVVFGAGEFSPDSESGRYLLAHELTHVVQQGGSGGLVQRQEIPDAGVTDAGAAPVAGVTTPPPAPLPEYASIPDAIRQASERFPQFAADLAQVTLQAEVLSDRTEVVVTEGSNRRTYTYPSQMVRTRQGYYGIKWNAEGNYAGVVDLQTGNPADVPPLVNQTAGREELRNLRRNRIGVIHVTQTVTPQRPRQSAFVDPDSIQFPLPSPHGQEITEEDFRVFRQAIGADVPLTILGLTGGTFFPEQPYGRPLDFRYYTHDGYNVLVSRELAGRPFYYITTARDIQDFLRFYPFEYAGASAAPWIPITRLLFDVGISFIPIIGPLYGLAQAGMAVHHAYHHWDEMSGWEKGLVGVTVLLSVVPAVRSARNIARGAAAYREGVSALVSSGITQQEASRLMLAAGVFQSERATLRVVDTLGDALRRGERLTAAELTQLESVFRKMLQRLPVAERNAIAAGFATQNLHTASEFLEGMAITELQLQGLRRLSPEVLVVLKNQARTYPAAVEEIAAWAARSPDMARAIDVLHTALGPRANAHLTTVVLNAGEEVLTDLARLGVQIPDDLATFVRRASNAGEAYRRLMVGTQQGGRNIAGLSRFLATNRLQPLTPALEAVQQSFPQVYLTAGQLAGLSRLNANVTSLLANASHAEVRAVATLAGDSAHAVAAVNQLANDLLPLMTPARRGYFVGMLTEVDAALLHQLGRSGISLNLQLLERVAAQSTAGRALQVLVFGYRRGTVQLAGLTETLAGQLTTVAAARQMLSEIGQGRVSAALFSEWAVSQQAMLRGVMPEFADGIATIVRVHPDQHAAKLAGIYRSLGGALPEVESFVAAVGNVERTYGTNVTNLNRLVSELAAGETKTMGASLTLTYITRRNVGAMTGFEIAATAGNRSRVYDLVAGGMNYEFKLWTGFGGRPAASAADEFARDVMIHAQTNFRELRWVIANDAMGSMPAIESMMRGVLSRREVREVLRQQGITADVALQRLENALQNGLVEFF